MSGHSEFAPIGNRNPPAQMPPVGPVGNNAGQPANVPQVQPQAQPENAPVERPNAQSMIQKLDAMLLKAAGMATKAVDESSIKKIAKTPGLGKADLEAIAASAENARRTMTAVSGFTGRQIASAFAADENGVFEWKDNAAATAIRAAIDAQAELSEKLHDLANRPKTTGAAFDAVLNLALQCDRRQTEIASLAMQLAGAASRVGNDPAAEKRLDMKLAALLPRQALSMHGNAEALGQLKAKLQPLADRLDDFAARPNASLSSAEFTKYAVELKDACDVLAKAAADGLPAPDGKGRVIPDGDFLASLAALASDARAKLEDARRSIGEAYLRNFIERNLGVAKELTIFAPENMLTVRNHSSLLAVAVELRRELGMAALEYMANPGSGKAMWKIENVLDSYAKLDEDDLRDGVEDLVSGCRRMMDGDKKWQRVSAMFHPKTSALRTQVAHFLRMVKAVRRDMTPEQFLSTSSARALVEGKLSFATLVEARVHGMSDADVDPALDDSKANSSVPLGSGCVNTVKLVTYKDGLQRVFKPEAPGRQEMESLNLAKDYAGGQQVANLNLATQSAAEVLGLTDVVPKCSVGMHDGDSGLFMEKVPGMEAGAFVRGTQPKDGSLSLAEVKGLPPDQHAKVIGGIMRGINRLEWLDIITGQGDRHPRNYMIQVWPDLTVSVKGIDNDMCFAAYRTGLHTYVIKGEAAQTFRDKCGYIIHKYPVGLQGQVRKRLFTDPGFSEDGDGVITLDATKFKAGELHYAALRAIGMNGAALPKYIDEDLYRELTSLRTGERREAYLADLAKRLPPDAVDSARRRLDQAIDYAIKLAAEYKVVRKDDFEKRDVQKSLLEPEINAGNVVKPVGNFQLRMEPLPKSKEQARRQVVRRANIQSKTIFMRDIYGKVTNADWMG